MTVRLGFTLLALLGLTAFAPAPFPQPQRRGQQPEITLKSFQGTWRIREWRAARNDTGYLPGTQSITHVRITEDRWAFLPNNDDGAGLTISIDHTKKPAQLTFYQPSNPKREIHGVGLIRRQGTRVQVLYCWGGEESRPLTFEPPPEGPWIITLEREK
jgi:uncharacterized protein (TIGR03067 family)